MPDPKDKNAEKERSRFIRETVSSSKNRGRRLIKRGAAVVLSALVFGVLAAWIFVLTKPFWESRFGEQETTAPEPVTIFVPTQAETTEAETEPAESAGETSEGRESEEDPFAAQWDALKPSVDEEINEKLQDAAARDLVMQRRKATIAAVNKCIVTISTRDAAAEGLDNDPEREQEQSGVIIAVTSRQILILTDARIHSEGKQLYAVFANSLQMPAAVRATDHTFGLTVLSVSRVSWTKEQVEGISTIQMGSSSIMDPGQTVIAMGAPMGHSRSVLIGSVSYISPNVQGADTSVRLLQTDIAAPKDANGILINTDGQMIGWITDQYPDYKKEGFLTAVTLFDLSSSIEKLSNGEEPALLGILGQNITPAMAQEYELPQGIYIRRCIGDTPADRAGIQNGDILTGINDTVINTFKDLDAAIRSHKPGDQVTLTIQRQGDGEYAELKLDAVLGNR